MRTCLYRIFDKEGVLLYVGIAGRVRSRMKQHARSSEWWSEATARKTCWYRTRPIALAYEREAIRIEKPKYNSVGTEKHSQLLKDAWVRRRGEADHVASDNSAPRS